jgi:hypothetical protein
MTDSRTSDQDVSRAIRSWLHEDRHEDASRVAGAVLDQVEATPRRRALWWPVRRTPSMNKILGFGLAAAAVVVLVLVGSRVIGIPGGLGGPGVEPSPTPEPTNLPDSGPLEPGAYRINPGPFTPVQLVMTIPAGWVADNFAVVAKNPGQPTEVGLAPDLVRHVYGDACASAADPTEIGPTADDLVAALEAQQNLEVLGVSDVLLGGNPAQRVDLAYPSDLDPATCRNGEALRIWADEGETLFLELGAESTASVYVADVAGHRVVVTTVAGPDAVLADIAERDGIIDTISIGP